MGDVDNTQSASGKTVLCEFMHWKMYHGQWKKHSILCSVLCHGDYEFHIAQLRKTYGHLEKVKLYFQEELVKVDTVHQIVGLFFPKVISLEVIKFIWNTTMMQRVCDA